MAGARPGEALALSGEVDKVTVAGREEFYRLDCDGTRRVLANVYRPAQVQRAGAGARIDVAFPLARLHFFDPADGKRIETAR